MRAPFRRFVVIVIAALAGLVVGRVSKSAEPGPADTALRLAQEMAAAASRRDVKSNEKLIPQTDRVVYVSNGHPVTGRHYGDTLGPYYASLKSLDFKWDRYEVFPIGERAAVFTNARGEPILEIWRDALHLPARVLEALLELPKARHDEAGGASQALDPRRHRAARHVDLGAAEIEPDVLQAREDVGIARAAQPHHVEEHRKALVVDDAVEVLEVDDVADVLARAVVLADFLRRVHGA